jgi:hypothetical protein
MWGGGGIVIRVWLNAGSKMRHTKFQNRVSERISIKNTHIVTVFVQ